MTPSEYLAWLDKEIAFYEKRHKNAPVGEGDDYALGCCNAYEIVKEKFSTIQFPSQPEENKVTN